MGIAQDYGGHEATRPSPTRRKAMNTPIMGHRATAKEIFFQVEDKAYLVGVDDEASTAEDSVEVATGMVMTEVWVKTSPLSDV
jgi:hypothetical protein